MGMYLLQHYHEIWTLYLCFALGVDLFLDAQQQTPVREEI